MEDMEEGDEKHGQVKKVLEDIINYHMHNKFVLCNYF